LIGFPAAGSFLRGSLSLKWMRASRPPTRSVKTGEGAGLLGMLDA
jgi:hypothetical protein